MCIVIEAIDFIATERFTHLHELCLEKLGDVDDDGDREDGRDELRHSSVQVISSIELYLKIYIRAVPSGIYWHF